MPVVDQVDEAFRGGKMASLPADSKLASCKRKGPVVTAPALLNWVLHYCTLMVTLVFAVPL